ncbi:centrosome-associated protein CEP250-like isoform X2 [Dermacentor albipictus]|uniref:centrosome-associated protein CEP250-like isoform X2 n=1 Tax=Dermacentor albipictus TaxID=60249 RepID=UPI0031FDACBC
MSWADAWKDGLPPAALRKIEAFEQQSDRLQKDCQQKQMKIDYLQQQLDKEKRKNDEAKGDTMRDMRGLETELADLRNKLAKVQQELATKDKQLRHLENQSKSTSNQSQSESSILSTPIGRSRLQRFGYGDTPATPDNRELRNKIAELEAKLREKQELSQPASMPSTPLRAQSLDRNNHEADRLRNENIQLRGQVQELEQRSRQITQQMECQVHNSEAARKTLEQRSREKEASLKEELRLLGQENGKLLKELNDTQMRLQQELTAATKSLDATKAQLERSEAKLSTQEGLVADLRKQVSRLEQQERQSSTQLADLNRALKNQEQAAKAAEAKNANLEVKVRDLETAIDSANREARRLEGQLHKSAQDLERQSQDLVQLQGQLANTKSQLLAMEHQKQSLEKDLSKCRSELQRESARCQNLEAQLQEAKQKMEELRQAVHQSDGNTERLRAELDRSQRAAADGGATIQKLESKLEDCERREREASQKASTLEREVQDLRKFAEESRTLARALHEKEQEVSTLTKSKQALDDAIKQLSNEVKQLSSTIEGEKARAAGLEKEIADNRDLVASAEKLRKDLEDATHLSGEVKAALEDTEKQKEALRVELERQTAECEKIPRLESALEESRVQLSKSEANMRELESLLSERESEKITLLKNLSEKEAALKDFESQAETLQKNAQQVEDELGSVRDRLLKSDKALMEQESALKEREVLLEGMKKELNDTVQKVQNLEQAEADHRRLAEEKEAEITALKQDISAEKEFYKLLEQQSMSLSEIESSKNALESELAAAAEKYAALQQEYQQCLQLIESKEGEVLSLTASVKEREVIVEELKKHIANAEENEKALLAKTGQEMRALEEQLSLATKEIRNLKTELSQQIEQHSAAVDRLEAMNAKVAEKDAQCLALLDEKKVLVFAQVGLEDELASSKRKIEDLQKENAVLDSQLAVSTAEVNVLQEKVDKLLTHEVARIQGELCQKISTIEELKKKIADLCEKEQELGTLREQLVAASRQCSEFEQQCEALRNKCEEATLREQELLVRLNVLSCQRDEETAERQALEHDLVDRNAERDEGLLQLASTQGCLEQALVVATEKDARIRELEDLTASTQAALDALKEETASLSHSLDTAGNKLQEAQQKEMQLVKQLEEKEAAITMLTEEQSCMKEVKAEALALKERLAALESLQEDVEELRQQLVERNAERDELHVTVMQLQNDVEAREQEINAAQLRQLQLESQLEEKEGVMAALAKEQSRFKDAEAEAVAMRERLATFESLQADAEELRHKLVERNGERDKLHVMMMQLQNDSAAREHELDLARQQQLQLESQLEEKERVIVALVAKKSLKDTESVERMAGLESLQEDAEELRRQLVERNGERDELCVTMMQLRNDAAAREQELGLALVEALEREATRPLRLLEYIRDCNAMQDHSVLLPEVVATLFEMYRVAVGFLEDLSSALEARHGHLQERRQRLIEAQEQPPEDGVASVESSLQQVLAQRQAVMERIDRLKNIASGVAPWAELPLYVQGPGAFPDCSVQDSTLMANAPCDIMESSDESTSIHRASSSHCQTEAALGETDMTNLSTCELTLSSTDSSEDELTEKMAHVCSLLAALRQSLQGLLNQTAAPPQTLTTVPRLSQYARRVEEEYVALQESVDLLKRRLPRFEAQEPPCAINVVSELRVQIDGTVEAAASVFFSPAGGHDSSTDEECYASFEEEQSSPNKQGGLQEPSSRQEPKMDKSEALKAKLVALAVKLDVFLTALAGFDSKEAADETNLEMQGEECAKLLDYLEMWAMRFNEFLGQVKETSAEVMQILHGDAVDVEDVSGDKPFVATKVALLRQFVQSALQQKEDLEKGTSALQQSLLDEQATVKALRQELEEQEEKFAELQLELLSVKQQADGTAAAETESLLKKIEEYQLTVKQLSSALEEVEDTLQATYAEKQKYEESATELQVQCTRAEAENQRVQFELSQAKDAVEKAQAQNDKLLTDLADAKASLEASLSLAERVDELDKELSETRRKKKETEERLEDESRQLAALRLSVDELLASNRVLEESSITLKEELQSVRAVQENQVAEIRSICMAMDVAFTEISAVGDTGVDLSLLRDALSRRQREFSSQLQQLADEKCAALLEVSELREQCSQAHAERERLEEEKRAVLRQAEEQELELLNSDSLLEENRVLQADMDKLVSKLEELEELRMRVASLEEEKSARDEHIASLLVFQTSARQVQLQLTDKEQLIVALEEELQLLRPKEREIEELRQLVSALEGKLSDLKSQYEAAQKDLEGLSHLRVKLQSVETSEAELKGQVEALKDRNECQAQELKQLMHELECQQASAEVSSGALQVMRDQLALEKEKTAVLTADVARQVAENTKLEQALESAQEGVRRQAAAQLALENNIQLLEEEKMSIAELLRSAEEENMSLKSLLDERNAINERLHQQYKTEHERYEQTKFNLEQILKEKQQYLHQLNLSRDEIKDMLASKAALEEEVSTLLQKVDMATEGRTQADHEAQRIRTLLDEKTSESEQLQRELHAISSQLEQSKIELTHLATEQEAHLCQLKVAQGEIAVLLASKLDLENEVSELLQKLDATKKDYSRAEDKVQSMKQTLKKNALDMEKMQADFDELRDELEQSKSQFAQLVAEHRESESQLRMAQDEVVNLSASKSALEAETHTLLQELHIAKENCARAEGEVQALQLSLDKKTSEMEYAQNDFVMVSQQLQESQSLAAEYLDKQKQLEDRLKSAQQEAAGVANVKSSLEQQVKQLTTEVELTQRKCQQAEDEASSLKQLLEERDSDIQCIRSDLEDVRSQLDKASHAKSLLQDEMKIASEKLQESVKKHEELLEAHKQSKSELQVAQERRDELEALVDSLTSRLSTSETRYEELECKIRTAKATIRRQEKERRGLDVEAEQLRGRLAQAEMELQQSGGARIQELEMALEDVRKELSEKQESVVEAWSKFDSVNTELARSKETVAWLRTHMRTYKKRISELEKKPGARANDEDKEQGAGATPATPAESVPTVMQQPPVVTQLSVCAESPSKAEFRMTVSALRSPMSATGTPAAKLFKRTLSKPVSTTKSATDGLPSATSKTTTMKRSLFSQPRTHSPSAKPREAAVKEEPSATSVSGVMTRNRRATTASQTGLGRESALHSKIATPKQRTVPNYSSNIRPRTESTTSSRGRSQRVQQLKQQATVEKTAPARSASPPASAAATAPLPKTSAPPRRTAAKPAAGVMTRSQRASAGTSKSTTAPESKEEEQADCKMQ